MIRIAIAEDEEWYAKQLEEYLHQYETEKGEKFAITYYKDGDTLVNSYKSQFDIIFLDIQMAFMDGMSAAGEIRKNDKEVIIIFVTNMKQYAIRGYTVGALDYIVKPISYFSFAERISFAIEKVKKRIKKSIICPVRGGVVRLDVTDLCYVESQRHMMIYHMVAGTHEGPGTMREIENLLTPYHFFRGNKGYLINLAHVEGVQDNCAVVHGEHLPLARSKRSEFMEALMKYWTEVS